MFGFFTNSSANFSDAIITVYPCIGRRKIEWSRQTSINPNIHPSRLGVNSNNPLLHMIIEQFAHQKHGYVRLTYAFNIDAYICHAILLSLVVRENNSAYNFHKTPIYYEETWYYLDCANDSPAKSLA